MKPSGGGGVVELSDMLFFLHQTGHKFLAARQAVGVLPAPNVTQPVADKVFAVYLVAPSPFPLATVVALEYLRSAWPNEAPYWSGR